MNKKQKQKEIPRHTIPQYYAGNPKAIPTILCVLFSHILSILLLVVLFSHKSTLPLFSYILYFLGTQTFCFLLLTFFFSSPQSPFFCNSRLCAQTICICDISCCLFFFSSFQNTFQCRAIWLVIIKLVLVEMTIMDLC